MKRLPVALALGVQLACAEGTTDTGGAGASAASADEPQIPPPNQGQPYDTPQPGCQGDPPGVCVPGVPSPCYEGPPGTDALDGCVTGQRFCNEHGTAYGPCANQVLPRPLDCAAPSAFTCNDDRLLPCVFLEHGELPPYMVQRIAAHPSAGFVRAWVQPGQLVVEQVVGTQTVWSSAHAITGFSDLEDIVRSLAVADDGTTIVALRLLGSLTLGSMVIQGPAAVVLELDPTGAVAWFRVWVGADSVVVNAVAFGPDHAVWIAGIFTGQIDFGSGTQAAAGEADGFVARLDAAGSTVWSRALGGIDDDSQIFAVAVDDAGTSFAGGWEHTSGSCNHAAALLASFDARGVLRWTKSFWGETLTSNIASIALDGAGAIYVSGRLDTDTAPGGIPPGHALDLGGGPLDGTAFVAKYGAADGQHFWSRSANDVMAGPNLGGHMAIAPSGNVVWASQQGFSMRIRSYHPDGYQLWEHIVPVTTSLPEPDDGVAQIPGFGLRGFALRQDGGFAIGGDFQGTIDLGDGPQTYSSRGFYAVYQP